MSFWDQVEQNSIIPSRNEENEMHEQELEG